MNEIYSVEVIFVVEGDAEFEERVKMEFITTDAFPRRAVLQALGKTEEEVERIEVAKIGTTLVKTHCIRWERL